METERANVVRAFVENFNATLNRVAIELRDWKMNEWRNMGFDTHELDKVVKMGNADFIKMIFSKYDKAVREFFALRKELELLRTRELDKDLHSLKREINLLRVDNAISQASFLRGRIENFKRYKLKLW